MSGSYQSGYPGSGGPPFNPPAQATQQLSFRTDINRRKTKKWVAARSVSYDGDDWGNDDDDEQEEGEEDEEEEFRRPPETSRFLSTTQQPTSVSHQQTTAPLDPIVESPSTQSPSFVRPADIYRRMQEEQEREHNLQESALSNPLPSEHAAAPSAPTPPIHQGTNQSAPPHPAADTGPSTSPLVIPDVKRLSGFGQDFFGDSGHPEQPAESSPAPAGQVEEQGASLHHVPSLGFTSVVHQAFDAAGTPSSSTGDFSRSNSDSMSVISPIISHGKSETDKTPPIPEDPTGESSAQEPAANFKPGHRRDLSIPSPGNGPDRVATVIDPEASQSTEVVRSSSQDSITSSEYDIAEPTTIIDETGSGEVTPRPLSAVVEPIHNLDENKLTSGENYARVPSPLQIPEEQLQSIPHSVPSSSTETSPQDLESDRLRREIIRSFSSDLTSTIVPQAQPQNIESEEPAPGPQRESSYLPTEYVSYWADEEIPPTGPLHVRSSASPAQPLSIVINPESAGNVPPSQPATSSILPKSHPKLKKRFSWEAPEDSEEDVLEESPAPPPVPAPAGQPIPLPPIVASTFDSYNSVPLSVPHQAAIDISQESENDSGHRGALAEYPVREMEVLAPLEIQVEEPPSELERVSPIQEPEPEPSSQIPTLTEQEGDNPSLQPQNEPPRSLVTESSLPSFRKILEIQSSDEKIRVFNDTREQFSLIDNGLEGWLRRSSESLPEHADIIQANGRLPGGAPTSGLPPRAKFPKLSSLGSLSLPSTSSSHGPDTSASSFSPGHARRSSGSPMTGIMTRQNVESRGKDLLHSAGALGGKAGGAARGLFAKGKSKLRGSDKVD